MAAADFKGRPLPTATIVVERGAVTRFAGAVHDDSPAYRRPDEAAAAGFAGIPASPTFSFAMGLLGAFPELQPTPGDDAMGVTDVIAELRRDGGMIMHAEQEFTYHAPILAGDTLTITGRIEDVYTRVSGNGRTMTFVKIRSDVTNAQGEPVVTEVMTLLHR
jgi:acyl dehydratase